MKVYVLFGMMLMVFADLFGQTPEVKIYKSYDEMYASLEVEKQDVIHVVNFWATWCKPCVKELPHIEALNKKFPGKVKITLVSLDFVNRIDSKLMPFITQNNLQSKVVLLDDADANVWINKVDPSWSGAIPATLVFYNGKKDFYEKEFHSASEVEKIINKISN